mgnify:CR=1 FL=1
MKIGFNPAIRNQNLYNAKRNDSEHASISNNQLAFKKVNQEFYNMAEKMSKDYGCMTSWWIERITDCVIWNEISIQDALDTMDAVRKFVNKGSMKAFERKYNYFKNY